MRSREPVVVGRENPRDDFKRVMEEGADRLRRGYHLVIFPQRTRSVQFEPAEFNSIGVKLARHAGAPVIPLALQTEAWGNGKRFKDFGRINPDLPMHFEF
ncbi:lysophospholipid acyltransferase family protein, partial [Arthrospira platensis SPKY1]|nr:lysophospholipid acyltransferase family protein [Arthrospira platensis SPKY1]